MHSKTRILTLAFSRIAPFADAPDPPRGRYEFHIRKDARDRFGLSPDAFSSSDNVVFADFYAARLFAAELNKRVNPVTHPELVVKAGKINAMALIDEILHAVCALYRESVKADAFAAAMKTVEKALGKKGSRDLLEAFVKAYPPKAVYEGSLAPKAWLEADEEGYPNALVALEELFMLRLANENPAFEPFAFLFDDRDLRATVEADAAIAALEAAFASMPRFGPDDETLPQMLRAPMLASPYSLAGQLDFIRRRWGLVIGGRLKKLLGSVDMLAEEEKPSFHGHGPGPSRVLSYEQLDKEYERFSEDKDWMPRVVMIAKSTLVWLDQLSKAYGRRISTLDAIPDEELDILAKRGFNALWLIGLWERSEASRRIKELCGNPEAAASAYSLFDYEIAGELGGWAALQNLKERAAWRGIRLAADMVPNHTGIDSAWVRERPELFVQRDSPPFPSYSYTGENLSRDPSVGIWLEDHYYDRRDAAVTFKRTDFRTGRDSYIYHGNDGTSMPWNDTAQIDFLKPEARAAVRERIMHVAQNFPIIRFDAAMIMAKRHFRRLWYPEPGHGGDIASRGEYALSNEDFTARMPEEFWREVVDECAEKTPDTLLLAEAFWMMEGYFVRTLGMHRVYNSAFMNMLKNKENKKYRDTIKNTQEFDKDILKRFVNFMNNPDEETAVAQFGKDDHYFGVCTLMATLPGLPMFGHGQVEGLTEKYGMEYRRAYRDERPDEGLIGRHEREVFPLLKKRYLFSGVDEFLLYDFVDASGAVNEDVYAYSNGAGSERALVIFNNAWQRAEGSIRRSCPYAHKLPGGGKETRTRSLTEGLSLSGLPDRYLVMREQRSGLWFLRRSSELADRGLLVIIDGFKCQVFMDVYEAADDELGSYGRLCDELAGAGVPDLQAALQDLALESLYAAWNAAFGPAYFSGVRGRLEAGADKPRRRPAAKPASAQAGLFDEAGAPAAADITETPAPDPEAVAAFARCALGYMAELVGAPIEPEEAVRRAGDCAAKAAAYARGLTDMIKATPSSPLGALRARILAGADGAELVASIAALLCVNPLLGEGESYGELRILVDRWCLDRKLRESMQAAGAHGDRAWQTAAFAKAVLPGLDALAAGEAKKPKAKKATQEAAPPEPSRAARLIASLAADDECARLIGLNVWDGVRWFNAERFDLAMAAAAATAALMGETKAAKAFASIEEAAGSSGWDLDRFIAAL